MAAMNERLAFLLALQEECGGAVRFDRWMREALYHERFGYYTTGIRGIGTRGDFTTLPVVNSCLARAIARWVRSAGARHVIEIGAGSGALMHGLLRELGWWRRPACHIVEISPVLREIQQDRLGRRVAWHASTIDALAACGGAAAIVSNELLDAFPCRIFSRSEAGWSELFLTFVAGRVLEIWQPAEALPKSTVFTHDWPVGQRVEVQESVQEWLDTWRSAWTAGEFLAVDYGAEGQEIYRRRPHGTLRAYAHQQRLEGLEVYAGFGRRDMTVDVNFSDIRLWVGKGSVTSLDSFLDQWNAPASSEVAAGTKSFRVLISQAPGCPNPTT